MRRVGYLPVIMALLGILALGCKKKDETAAAPADETAAAAEKAAAAEPAKEEAQKEEPKAEAAAEADSVGVPECDEYLTKYEKCIKGNVPETNRAAMEKGITQMRAAWRQAAQTEDGKQNLANACKSALDSAKQAMAAYNCEW